VDAAGGPVLVLCNAEAPCGGTWSADGSILFGGATDLAPLSRVPETGGQPVAVTRLLPTEEGHRWPSFLPDGRHFVFLGDAPKAEDHWLCLGSLDSPESKALIHGVSSVQYAAPGWLLFVRSGDLMAQRLDVGAARLTGEPVRLAQHLAQDGNNHRFEFSAGGGVLSYRSVDDRVRLAWMDGATEPSFLPVEPTRYDGVALSKDGRQIVYTDLDADSRANDVWALDLQRGVRTRISSDPAAEFSAIWSPTGDRIAFCSLRSGGGDLFIASATSPDDTRVVIADEHMKTPECWSPDGRELLYSVDTPANKADVWAVDPDHPQDAHAVLAGPAGEFEARYSPDGRWLAWTSDESGSQQVYVRLEGTGRRWQVSSAGGGVPRWMPDGKTLVWQGIGSIVMAASIDGGPNPSVGAPHLLFSIPGGNLHDVAPDGRFLVDVPVDDVDAAPLTVVLDWTALLPAR